MTIEELVIKLETIPDDWEIAPYAQFQGVVNTPWVTLLVAHFKRHYTYPNSERSYNYDKELQNIKGMPSLDQMVLYAQPPDAPIESEQEYGQ